MERPFSISPINQSLIVLAVSAFVFFLNLGASQLWDRDEPRNAGCAAEMMQRHDWIVPIFNDQLRHQKPVMLYWLIMSAYAVFGETEFAARFWSALLGCGTTLFTWQIGRRLWGGSVGMWSAIILASTVMFGVAARAATPDSALIFAMTGAFWFYVRGTFEKGQPVRPFPQKLTEIIGFYLMLGLGVLTKGLAGFLIPMMITGLFMLLTTLKPCDDTLGTSPTWASRILRFTWLRIWHPRHFLNTFWQMRPLSGIGLVLLVALPWFIIVGLRTEGEFIQRFFVEEHWGRATTVFENHRGGLWYYPAAILLGFFPWSILTVPIALEIRACWGGSDRSALVFLLVWVGIQVGLFSAVSTKLPSYVTPCYPALALLTGYVVDRYASEQLRTSTFWFRAGQVCLSLAALGVMIGLGWVGERYLAGKWELAGLALPLLLGSVGAFVLSKQRPLAALSAMAAACILFCGLMWGWGTTVVNQTRNSQVIFETIRSTQHEVPLATFGCLESTWIYYAQRPIIELETANSNARTIPSPIWQRSHDWSPWPKFSPEQFTDHFSDTMILTTDEWAEELRNRLPADYQVVATGDYFLKDRRLVLFARPDRASLAAEPRDSQRR